MKQAGSSRATGSWATRSLATPGRAIALVIGLIGLYFAWGAVFTPGGTGSNVVLGLLVAGAALYLVTVNLGAALDDSLFHGGDRERALLLRRAGEVSDDAAQVLKVAAARANKKGRKQPQLDEAQREELARDLEALRAATEALAAAGPGAAPQKEQARVRLTALEAALNKAVPDDGKGGVLAQARSLGFAFAIALALRAFAVEPFQIPSGSMIPTLLVGDHLFVARAMYGLQVPFARTPKYFLRWSVPRPGDVVVFVAPPYVGDNAGEDWIKRVIAGPGQRVKMVDTVLHVDGVPYAHMGEPETVRYLDYEERSGTWHDQVARHVVERIPAPGGAARPHSAYLSLPTREAWPTALEPVRTRVGNMGPAQGLQCTEEECLVLPGYVFVMGDNRDHSSDGRRWGAVPIDNVKGRALFIWMSVDGSERSVDLGRFTLPRFRWERLFDAIR